LKSKRSQNIGKAACHFQQLSLRKKMGKIFLFFPEIFPFLEILIPGKEEK